MSKTQSELLDWFERQFGRRESALLKHVTDSELRKRIEAGKAAETELKARKLWDEREQAALYAWCAHDNRSVAG